MTLGRLVQFTCAAAEESKPVPTAAPAEIVRSCRAYWTMDEKARERDVPIDWEIQVNFFDPYWKLLWYQDSEGSYFTRVGSGLEGLQAGHCYHLRGYINAQQELNIPSSGEATRTQRRPTEPKPIHRNLLEWQNFDASLVRMEGYVDRVATVDARHLLLRFLVEGTAVEARILMEPGEQEEGLEGSLIEAVGVYTHTSDALGRNVVTNLWIPAIRSVKRKGWLVNDSRFAQTATPVDRIGSLDRTKEFKVSVKVISQNMGYYIIGQDNTGQVMIQTTQSDPLNPGDQIEAVGLPGQSGLTTTLSQALFRKTSEVTRSPDAGDNRYRLRLAEQVISLSLDEAARGMPARIIGVVTWANPKARFFYLQDATGGLRVQLPDEATPAPVIGELFQITGRSSVLEQSATLQADHLLKNGSMEPPRPRHITLEQAQTGLGANTPVEIIGFLQGITPDGDWQRLHFTTESGTFEARLPADQNANPLLRSILRVRGICTLRNADNSVCLLADKLSDFRQQEPPPNNVYEAPPQPLNIRAGNLRRPGELHWIRTQGTVTLQIPGVCLYLQSDAISLCVLTRQTTPLNPGDKVVVAGIAGRENARDVLREAIFLRSDSGTPVSPLTVPKPSPQDIQLDGRLIRIEGIVLEGKRHGSAEQWLLQSGTTTISCEQPGLRNGETVADLSIGSLVSATGVARIIRDEYGAPSEFKLLIRDASDLALLREPSWWNMRNSLIVAGGLAACLLCLLVVVALLRRTIARQTTVIEAQLREEARLKADLEKSARLESLGLLAGGIAHDFNNILTVVSGNVTLALMEAGVEERAGHFLKEAEQGALRARGLTQQLLTFAKGGNPICRPEDLAALARNEVEATIGKANAEVVQDSLSKPSFALIDRDQIRQVIHNLVLNALQATEDKRLRLTLTLREERVTAELTPGLPLGNYLVLTLADNGPGIPTESLPRLFDPYFTTKPGHHGLGLSMVRSIVGKHQGHVSVSTSHAGCAFSLWLPAAENPASRLVPASGGPPQRQTQGNASAPRILFMDDESPIRLMAGGLLKKMGIEVVMTADGDEALKAFVQAREQGRPFSLIITDLTVPQGAGGRETIEGIRKLDTKVPAIVSSGYSSDPVMSRFRDYGFTAMLPKPYQIADLEKIIREQLGL